MRSSGLRSSLQAEREDALGESQRGTREAIDAGCDALELAAPQLPIDGCAAETRMQSLGPGNQAMLATGELDERIRTRHDAARSSSRARVRPSGGVVSSATKSSRRDAAREALRSRTRGPG